MCEPMTIATTVMAVAGTGLKLQAQERDARAQRAAAAQDAFTLDSATRDARGRGDVDAQRTQLAAGAMAGRQRAAYAAAGVDVGAGSAADVVATTRAMGA